MTDQRFEHLTDVVDRYSWLMYDKGVNAKLSDDQGKQLTEVRDKLKAYSDAGDYVADLWLECANEILMAN